MKGFTFDYNGCGQTFVEYCHVIMNFFKIFYCISFSSKFRSFSYKFLKVNFIFIYFLDGSRDQLL